MSVVEAKLANNCALPALPEDVGDQDMVTGAVGRAVAYALTN
jgi:hypothetical protein